MTAKAEEETVELEEKMKESKLETPSKCKFLQSDHIRLRSIYCTLKQGPHSAVNIQPKRMMDIGEEKIVLKVHFSFYGQATVPKRPCFFSNSSQIAYSQSEADTRAESTEMRCFYC